MQACSLLFQDQLDENLRHNSEAAKLEVLLQNLARSRPQLNFSSATESAVTKNFFLAPKKPPYKQLHKACGHLLC